MFTPTTTPTCSYLPTLHVDYVDEKSPDCLAPRWLADKRLPYDRAWLWLADKVSPDHLARRWLANIAVLCYLARCWLADRTVRRYLDADWFSGWSRDLGASQSERNKLNQISQSKRDNALKENLSAYHLFCHDLFAFSFQMQQPIETRMRPHR